MLLTFSLRMAMDFSLDRPTKTFIGISNPPWKKGDGLYLSDITFLDIMVPLSNAYHIYLLNSRGISPTSAWPIFPTRNSKSIIRIFFFLCKCYHLANEWVPDFFDAHVTHVIHCRSCNQVYQHQQFQWTFCFIDFWWFFSIQLSLSKLILETQNTVTKYYHTVFEWMKYSNQMFY